MTHLHRFVILAAIAGSTVFVIGCGSGESASDGAAVTQEQAQQERNPDTATANEDGMMGR